MERKPDWLSDFPVQIYCNSKVKSMLLATRRKLRDYLESEGVEI